MSTILPESESLRKAVKWVSEQIKERPNDRVQTFVNEAITRFDLSPKDSTFLMRFFSKKE
ncbi:hypothetical protein GWO43_07910 [candidate division KSB1 bacterium]|nr:hypothetical protein [candidate division KSB1 bacterium]NIS23894.1 hypothetical protein [candidate division KSB1 bacterium]NIT70811.1 hypothetical protein [candidate division KSB1 bacterium]NIU24543.1 hypothetical protein [candidate division KSB1 bacterium]NIU94497.1 hypothetical protein [candidate division KSB1 bacterium]